MAAMTNAAHQRLGRLAALVFVALVASAYGCGGNDGPARDAGAEGKSVDAGGPAELCTATGGTVGTQLCCGATPDFPDTCGVGSCGCSPSGSHEVQFCTCPSAGTCFTADKGCHAP
jgi:hypothetical protein